MDHIAQTDSTCLLAARMRELCSAVTVPGGLPSGAEPCYCSSRTGMMSESLGLHESHAKTPCFISSVIV